jgi:hypothetical protein
MVSLELPYKCIKLDPQINVEDQKCELHAAPYALRIVFYSAAYEFLPPGETRLQFSLCGHAGSPACGRLLRGSVPFSICSRAASKRSVTTSNNRFRMA